MAAVDGLRSLLDDARGGLDDVVALRRALHRRPELGLRLPETQAAVLEAIAGLPVEVRTGSTTSSVVAVLDGGGGPGATILLRADMDALPLQEDNELEFASEIDGRMHACGHDAHTAMLVGALRLLAARHDDFPGRVVTMFQPGEEGFHGARAMLDEGLLDAPGGGQDPAVTGAFAIHITPSAPAGLVATRPGTLLASADEFEITVEGRGGHGSMPHRAVDPVPVACEIVLALQSAVTRAIDVFNPAVVTVGELRAGTATNVIPQSAFLRGTVRSTSERTRARAQELLERVASGVAAAHGATAEVTVIPGYSVTANHAGFVDFVAGVARDLLGDDQVAVPLPNPAMGAEDFGEVLDRVPGAMVFLGACPAGVDPWTAPANHSNLMRIDESAMATGVALYAGVALAHLGAPAAVDPAPAAGA